MTTEVEDNISVIDKFYEENNALFFQFPFWIRNFNGLTKTKSIYIKVKNDSNEIVALASIVCVNKFGFKIGLCYKGPVITADYIDRSKEIYQEIFTSLKKKQFDFIKFTSNKDFIISEFANVEEIDLFPFYKDFSKLLLIEKKSDELLLKSFQTVVRSDIKKAVEFGYKIVEDNTREGLIKAYNVFQSTAQRKSFLYRPLDSYIDLFDRANATNKISIFLASYNEINIGASIIIYDSNTAHYMSGGIDIETIREKFKEKRGPYKLLQYKAMLSAFDKGYQYYNLWYVGETGGVAEFKRSFNPTVFDYGGFVCVVNSKFKFRLYSFILKHIDINKIKKIARKVMRK